MMLQGCAGRETKQDAVATPTNTISPEEEKYQKAEQYYKDEDYEDAATLFQELGSYNDSSIRYKDTLLLQAKKRYEAGEYTNVIKMLSNLDSEKASELIRGKRVLVLDDILSTDATISLCVKNIRRYGPGKLHVIKLFGNRFN